MRNEKLRVAHLSILIFSDGIPLHDPFFTKKVSKAASPLLGKYRPSSASLSLTKQYPAGLVYYNSWGILWTPDG